MLFKASAGTAGVTIGSTTYTPASTGIITVPDSQVTSALVTSFTSLGILPYFAPDTASTAAANTVAPTGNLQNVPFGSATTLVPGNNYPAGSALGYVCTTAGTLTMTLFDGSTINMPLSVNANFGISVLPFAVTRISLSNGLVGSFFNLFYGVPGSSGSSGSGTTTVAGALLLVGGAMTGPLTLAGDPTTALQAATKQYVDSHAAGSGPGGGLPLTGGTLTGPLTLSANPSSALQAATKQYVDSLAGGSTGPVVATGAVAARSAADRASDKLNVLDFYQSGDGNDYYPAFNRAIQRAYAQLGGHIYMPRVNGSILLSQPVLIFPGSYVFGGSIVLELGPNNYAPSHTGWCFDVTTNYFDPQNPDGSFINHNNGGLGGKKKVIILGCGAVIQGSGSAAGGVRFTDTGCCSLEHVTIYDYTAGAGVQLNSTVTNVNIAPSRWTEEHHISQLFISNCQFGVQLNSVSTVSFLGTVLSHITVEGRASNSVLFDLDGGMWDAIAFKCGGFINQAGITGGLGWRLNGSYSGTTFLSCWIELRAGRQRPGRSHPLADRRAGVRLELHHQPDLAADLRQLPPDHAAAELAQHDHRPQPDRLSRRRPGAHLGQSARGAQQHHPHVLRLAHR